jgi:hypothetical protein
MSLKRLEMKSSLYPAHISILKIVVLRGSVCPQMNNRIILTIHIQLS